MGYGCLLDFAALSQFIRHIRLVSGFCSSGYDFAIPSSRLHLTMQTLGVALGFVGNYAPCGLSPQTDGMPVIPKKECILKTHSFFSLHSAAISFRISFFFLIFFLFFYPSPFFYSFSTLLFSLYSPALSLLFCPFSIFLFQHLPYPHFCNHSFFPL